MAMGRALVDPKVDWKDLPGKVALVQDADGNKLACSPLSPINLLHAANLHPYGCSDPEMNYCVTGSIYLQAEDDYHLMSYDLYDVDPRCGQKDIKYPRNGCRVQIHEGRGQGPWKGPWQGPRQRPRQRPRQGPWKRTWQGTRQGQRQGTR
eukprot:TRINITY_DN3643_c2_g1_i7.p2 TRINITY_DN3643_c2_g1~~TRINITY_DN3643_c2_g1_i7.p2  ORF type:complete len:150 (+),score=17.90 TRINITY_DN3643_c2_g1_i7:521-970(+)